MKIGISTACLHKRLYNEDALALFSEWGVETSEVFLTSFCEYDKQFAYKLYSIKKDVGVHSVHSLNTHYEPQLYADHHRVRNDAYYWLQRVLQAAKILGAKYYTFHGLARLKRTFEENLPYVAKQTGSVYDYCMNLGIKLCFENVEWAFFNRPDIFRELKAACPDLGAVLDLKQARISGYDYFDYLKEMGSNLTHVHVSDYDGDKLCLPGTGKFDFKTLFNQLADVGFDGAVLIENYPNDFGNLGELKTSYEYLKELSENFRN